MTGTLHPSQGARFLFERRSVAPDQSSATYRAAVITPDDRFEYDAVLRLDGTAELTPLGPAATEWEARLTAHARQAARAAQRRRAEDLPPWPPRLLRWRA